MNMNTANKINTMSKLTISFIIILLGCKLSAQDKTTTKEGEERLLRFPAIYENNVVFSYAGDLYTANIKDGKARKITSDVGYESFPKFSSDGKKLAFTGQYDGNTEVYVMPSTGGVPKRITYTATLGRDDMGDRMGPNNIVMEWSPDDKSVIYRSRRYSFNSFKGQLFSAPLSADLSTQLPFSVASWCSYSEDGKHLAYNRVFREFRTWKYYRGGMADDIWWYDIETEKTINLTNNPAQDIFPMVHSGKVYFLSDRDRIMNLFVYDIEAGTTKKLTSFDTYDIKFPSLCKNQIAFENGGFIYSYNVLTSELKKINIYIQDDKVVGRNTRVNASSFISSANISPDGKRVAFSARGDIFTVPKKNGVTRNLTYTSTAHDRAVEWSPSGEWIAYLSDRTGEYQLYLSDPLGVKQDIQLTTDLKTYPYQPIWSPDSKYILLTDRNQDVYYIDVNTKKKTLVFHSDQWEVRDVNWSPDSRWILYVRPSARGNDRLYLFNLETKMHHQITSGWYSVSDACFSPDGNYLYFVSKRHFQAIYNNIEWNHAYRDMAKIYILPLRKDVASPFFLVNDEAMDSSEYQITKNPRVEIDLEGIENRIQDIPVPHAQYYSLQPSNQGIYYLTNSLGHSTALKFFDLKKKKETTLTQCDGFQLSEDDKHLLISKAKTFYIENTSASEITLNQLVNVDGLTVIVNRQEEWKQIFEESWRQMRDFFYDPGMHGVEWDSIYHKYKVLLPYVNHRTDLNYVIGEMIGELNVGHAYVTGGDRPESDRITMGLLGATFQRDPSGYYQIKTILKGANWHQIWRSPFQDVGVHVSEGEYIISIDGKDLKDVTNIYETLIGKGEVQVELWVNDKPSSKGARKVIVQPLNDESSLYYFNWVENNLEKVNKATNSKVGYIHIPDMLSNGLNQFARYFYAQIEKEALIVDDRGNGGGNVSTMIIERLRRELAMLAIARNGAKETRPGKMIHGPKICLVNMYSASDGDLFPYQFRYYGLGKLVGNRTWGGVVGIRGSLPFIDGGGVNKPEFAHYAADGSEWIIEGHGVEPDIECTNDPHDEFLGKDEQLQKAIDIMKDELQKNPSILPDKPEYPDKSE